MVRAARSINLMDKQSRAVSALILRRLTLSSHQCTSVDRSVVAMVGNDMGMAGQHRRPAIR
jgi:hypothetical protein